MIGMIGTMFCQYETPCGICTRTHNPCTEHKPKIKKQITESNERKNKVGGRDE